MSNPWGAPIRFAEPDQPAAGAAPGVRAEAGSYSNLSASELVRMGIFGAPSQDGPAVTDLSAMQVGTVYSCLEKTGGVVLQLPLHDYRLDDSGERDRVQPASPIWWLLNESPSPAWTAASWKEWIVQCVKLRGDQHTEIIRSVGGAVLALQPHHPDCVRTVAVGNRLRYDVMDPETGKVRGIDQDDMLHFTGFGFNGLTSISAIKWAARNAISNSLAGKAFMSKALSSGGMPKVAFEYPNKLSTDAAKLLRDNFTETYMVGDGSRLPLVMSEGGNVKTLSISPVDMEIMASLKMDKAEICEALGVPPIIIGDSEKTSSWGSGVEQITLGWVKFSIQPMLARWEEELNRKLFRRAGRFVEFSLEALLRGDTKTQADVYRAALGGPGTGDGWMSVNQVRRLQNLPPIPGAEYDTPYRAKRDQPAAPPAA